MQFKDKERQSIAILNFTVIFFINRTISFLEVMIHQFVYGIFAVISVLKNIGVIWQMLIQLNLVQMDNG